MRIIVLISYLFVLLWSKGNYLFASNNISESRNNTSITHQVQTKNVHATDVCLNFDQNFDLEEDDNSVDYFSDSNLFSNSDSLLPTDWLREFIVFYFRKFEPTSTASFKAFSDSFTEIFLRNRVIRI